MKCIAHRGYSIDRINNSIDAIQEAVAIPLGGVIIRHAREPRAHGTRQSLQLEAVQLPSEPP